MAKLGIVLDTRNKKSELFPLVIRISHKSKWKYLQTGYRVKQKEWSDSKKELKKPFPNMVRANAKLRKKFSIASDVISEHNAVMKKLTMLEVYNLIHDRIEESDNTRLGKEVTIIETAKKTYFKTYSEMVIAHTRKVGSAKYANSLQEAVNYFLKFHGSDKLLMTEIDTTFLERLEAYYIVNSQKGDSLNGLGAYLRNVRKIINAAIKDKSTEVTMEHYPFGQHGYSIKKTSTKKRAVKLTEFEKIKNFKPEKGSALWHHKNFFLFYFYMRGMNFIDLAHLKMDNIEDDRLVYKRRKTKRGQNSKEFNIKISTDANKILKHYTKNKGGNDFIFPIMTDTHEVTDPVRLLDLYENKRNNHNNRLKAIAKTVGINTKLTTYVARHSFATAGLHSGLSKAEIGDMLGHTNYYTTETYLSGFEQKTLDDAADKIFSSTTKKKTKNKKK